MHAENPGTERPVSYTRKGAAIMMAALLVWFVGVQGLAAIAAKSANPALLRVFDPGTHPAAGYQLARIYLIANQPDQAVAIARPAAFANPMDVRTIRTLGLALDARNYKTASARVMRAAETLSWRDTPTSLWVMRDAALQRDMPRVMNQMNALARRQTESELIKRFFYAGLDDAGSRQALTGLLANAPPWRSGFFAEMRINLQPHSYDKMEQLLDLLDRSKMPPSPAERMTFIARMTDTGDAAKARAYWIRTFGIAASARNQILHDPLFHAVATRSRTALVSPFEWNIGVDADSFVAFRRGDGGYVLDVNPATDVGMPLLTQVVFLTPGSHRIDTDITQGSPQKSPAEWQLACVPSGSVLIRRFATPGNGLSGVIVSIPSSGCDVQQLSLVTSDRIDANPVTIRSVLIR